MNMLPLVAILATECAAAPAADLPGLGYRRGPATYTPSLGASSGKLSRFVARVRRMPKHTKIVLGLVAAGVVLFFVGVWAKSRL